MLRSDFIAYLHALKNHDWYYAFSDCSRTYRAGDAAAAQLLKQGEGNELLMRAHALVYRARFNESNGFSGTPKFTREALRAELAKLADQCEVA